MTWIFTSERIFASSLRVDDGCYIVAHFPRVPLQLQEEEERDGASGRGAPRPRDQHSRVELATSRRRVALLPVDASEGREGHFAKVCIRIRVRVRIRQGLN